MLLSFSSELTSCGHWWLAEVNEMLREILFPRCFVGVFRGWNTNGAITWGMRCSVMFIRAKRKEWSCSLSLRVTAQTREPELIAAKSRKTCMEMVWYEYMCCLYIYIYIYIITCISYIYIYIYIIKYSIICFYYYYNFNFQGTHILTKNV